MRSPTVHPGNGFAAIALVFAGALTFLAPLPEARAEPANGSEPYRVKCGKDGPPCKVGHQTYEGWRAFAGFCERCHGPGGLGSSLGPDLIERLGQKTYGKDRFLRIVRQGWDGPMKGKMPAFGQNPNVNNKLGELWAYLQARVDGRIGPGRPEQIGAEPLPEDAPANWE